MTEMQPRCTEVAHRYNEAGCCEVDTLVEMCSFDSRWNGEQCECAQVDDVVSKDWQYATIGLIVVTVLLVFGLCLRVLHRKRDAKKATVERPMDIRTLSSINRLRGEKE